MKNLLIWKDPHAGKDWRQEEKGTTEEMVGWHQRPNGHEFVQASEDGEGQGSLACCSPWGRKESGTTEQLNNRRATGEADFHYIILFLCCLSHKIENFGRAWTEPKHIWWNEMNENTSRLCYRLVAQSCLPLCDPMDCSTPVYPVLHHLLELAQTHVHWVSDAIQPSHPLSSPSPPAFNLSQHQGFL